MKKSRQYLFNAILLSVVLVSMRAISVSFNAFVTKKIGAEGVGLFTLVMSVYSLAVTFAVSSVNLAAVRLVSERLALCHAAGAGTQATKKALRATMRGCICYSLIFGTAAAILLFCAAKPIGTYILCDARTISSLKLSAPALPAISLSSALAGYFTGLRKIYKNAIISVGEQFVQIALTSAAIVIFAPRGIEYACLSVVGGAAISEGASLILSFILYITDKGERSGQNNSAPLPSKPLKRTAEIALPVAMGSYVRQGLMCAEHVAIPAGLKKFSKSGAGALASYGVLHGMAFPLIFFPASVISAFCSLLIPELSEFHALKDKDSVRSVSEKCIKFGIIFSVAVSGVFLAFGKDLALSVYGNDQAGIYIAAMAPLIPVMYIDTAVDAVLKGSDQQLYCMKVNILDAFLSLILVLCLVPRFGCGGYIACVYITELINALLSISKMVSVTDTHISLSSIAVPPLLIFASVSIIQAISHHIYISTPTEIAAVIILYSALLLCRKTLSGQNPSKRRKSKNLLEMERHIV